MKSGVWTKIEGTYEVPESFSKLTFYVEGPSGNFDFLVDDLTITQTTAGNLIRKDLRVSRILTVEFLNAWVM